jgi:hypothetical protein
MTEFQHGEALTSTVQPGDEAYLALFAAWVEQTPMPIVAQLGDLPQPYLSQVYVTRFEREASTGGYTLELEPTDVFEPLPEEEA